jgi:hypothetical protein
MVGFHFGSHGYTIYLLVMLTIKGKLVEGKHQGTGHFCFGTLY